MAELNDPRDRPTEREGLTEFLEYYRGVLRRKAEGLAAGDLGRRHAPSTLSLGGLLKHMALVENDWFVDRIAGERLPEPWTSVDWGQHPDWEFESAADDSPEQLLALYDEACQRSRIILAEVDDLDQLLVRTYGGGKTQNVRWVLIHMIEEYARHSGHADLIRESIDGSTGD